MVVAGAAASKFELSEPGGRREERKASCLSLAPMLYRTIVCHLFAFPLLLRCRFNFWSSAINMRVDFFLSASQPASQQTNNRLAGSLSSNNNSTRLMFVSHL